MAKSAEDRIARLQAEQLKLQQEIEAERAKQAKRATAIWEKSGIPGMGIPEADLKSALSELAARFRKSAKPQSQETAQISES